MTPRPPLRPLGALSLAVCLASPVACERAALLPRGPSAGAASPASAPSAAPAPPPLAPFASGAMPGDVEMYAELPSLPAARSALEAGFGAEALSGLGKALAGEAKLDEALAARLFSGASSLCLGGRRAGGAVELAASVLFADAGPMREEIARGSFVEGERVGVYGRVLAPRSGAARPRLVWFEAARLLVIGDEAMQGRVAAVLEGRSPGLSSAQRSLLGSGEGQALVGFIAPPALEALTGGGASFTSPLSIAFRARDGGLGGEYRTSFTVSGGAIEPPPARPLPLARRLPAETVAYAALSTALPGRRGGGIDLFPQMAALATLLPDASSLVLVLDYLGSPLGLKGDEVLGALGGEGVIGVAVRPGVVSGREAARSYAVVVLQEISDHKRAAALIEAARKKLSAIQVKVRAERGGFSIEADAPSTSFVRVNLGAERLIVATGPRDLVERASLAADKGQGALGDDPAHARALRALPAASQARLWVDAGRLFEIAASGDDGDRAALVPLRGLTRGPGRLTSGASLTASAGGGGVALALDEINGVSLLGSLGALGVSRYLKAAKTAEAKNALGAIARSAAAAYEREPLTPGVAGVVHRLCASAQPVPLAVPRGVTYPPSTQSGADYDAGDDERGWKCLRFSLEQPQRFRYTYSAGGPYKGPARGGPDPGPQGFEVAAEGDLDGDGVTSLFTLTGRVDPGGGGVRIAPVLFVDKEYE